MSRRRTGSIPIPTMKTGRPLSAPCRCRQPIDIHDPESIRRYYRQLLGTFRGDKKALEKALAERDFPAVSQQYRLIEQRGVQIIVPYEGQRALYDKLRAEAPGNRPDAKFCCGWLHR